MRDARQDFFTKLFADSRSALRRYVRRLVGSSETADEIVQEAFLRTYERGKIVETPRAFLFTTARNLASNVNRAARLAKTDSVGDFDDERVVAKEDSPEEGALAEEEARLVRQAVHRLPPKCRAAFALRVFHGYSYKEIADKLGVSVKTVEKYITRGLEETHARLQRRYREAGGRHG